MHYASLGPVSGRWTPDTEMHTTLHGLTLVSQMWGDRGVYAVVPLQPALQPQTIAVLCEYKRGRLVELEECEENQEIRDRSRRKQTIGWRRADRGSGISPPLALSTVSSRRT